MSTESLYSCKPRQARAYVKEVLEAGLVPFLQSSPGIGKSTIVKSVFDELRLKTIDHRLSTSAPEDLSGLPHFVDGKAKFAPFADLFPLQDTPIPQGKDGWGLFLDEFNSASKAVQAASYKLILDRQTGQFDLHDNVAIVCAGNLASDRAIVNNLSTAMQSRVVHIEMIVDYEQWLYDVALPQQYDPRIIAYISMNNSALMDFKPDHKNKTFACPRTWEFVDRMVNGKPITDDKTGLYAGTITAEIAAAFVQFTKVYENMVSVKEILADPENCPVPGDNATRWAVISHMMEHVDDQTFDGLARYAGRFDLSMRVLFFRAGVARHPDIRRHPAWIRAQSAMARYLNG